MHRLIVAALALSVAAFASAQTVTVTPSPIVLDATCDLYRGTSIVRRDVANTPAAIAEAMRADALGRRIDGNYTCRTSTPGFADYNAATPTCTTPQPPAETLTVQCPAPTVGSWTQTRTFNAAPYPTCWSPTAYLPTSAPPGACTTPPPTCGPVSPPETRTQTCPAGTTGSWSQTRSFSNGTPPACNVAGPWLPASAPAGSCTPIVTPPATGALHFSPTGANSNPGTLASPKRDLSGINVNTLPAGLTLLFARGGTWDIGTLILSNPNLTAAAPGTLDAYGEGPAPVLTTASRAAALQIGGRYDQPQYRYGHWRIRNLKIEGQPNAQTGIWLIGRVQNVEIENVEITGFWIGIYGSRVTATDTPQNVRVLNSRIVRNGSMGWLGSAEGSRWEGNLFDANNFGGSAREHGFYGSYLNNGVFRNNVLRNNSVVNGVCLGGTWTLHGNTRNLLVEGNLIEQPAAAQTCYGFSVTKGYTNANSGGESFDEVVLRGNTVINSGQCSICVNSAPGIVVEGNRFFREANDFHRAILAPATGENSVPMPGGVIRDNTLCRQTAGGDVALLQWSPTPAVSEGNSTRTGADATTGPCAR